MVYNPGILHEYNQVPFYYQIGFDFTIVVCKEGHSSNTLRYFYDYEYSTESVDLIKGDVIKIKYFKIKVDDIIYAFLELMIKPNGEIINYNIETLSSLSFFNHNIKTGLFTDVTKIFQRDNKINQILN